MKNTLLLVLMLFPVLLTAQHWAPVKMGERYNYRQAPADVITQTLWADSVKVVNGDSVWYMNRTVQACDTCRHWGVFYGNQPFFIGGKIIKQVQGHFLLISNDTLDFQTFRQKGESWFFHDTTIANVDSVWIANLFGQPADSFKSLQLSNGGEIHFSKNHGITFWNLPDDSSYSLVGLQGTTPIGEQVPMYEDFYGDGYAVGDVIEWSETAGGVMFEPKYNAIQRILITQIDTLQDDSLEVTLLHWQKTKDAFVWCEGIISHPLEDFGCNPPCSPNTIKRKILSHKNHPANGWPGQLVYSGQPLFEKNVEPRFAISLLAKTQQGKIIKMAGRSPYDCLDFSPASSKYLSLNSGFFEGNFASTQPYLFDFFELKIPLWGNAYFPGSGLTFWSNLTFEGTAGGALLGHIHQGDTTGSILPESYWWPTGLQPEGESLAFGLFPNPAQDYFSIQLPESSEPLKIRLNNLLGKAIQSWYFPTSSYELNLELGAGISPGLYVVEVEQQGIRSSKLLTVH